METDEIIIIALNIELNLGSKYSTAHTISEDNIAPVPENNPQDSLSVIWESDDLIDVDKGSGGTMPWWFAFAALSLMVYRYRFINRLINNTKKGTR